MSDVCVLVSLLCLLVCAELPLSSAHHTRQMDPTEWQLVFSIITLLHGVLGYDHVDTPVPSPFRAPQWSDDDAPMFTRLQRDLRHSMSDQQLVKLVQMRRKQQRKLGGSSGHGTQGLELNLTALLFRMLQLLTWEAQRRGAYTPASAGKGQGMGGVGHTGGILTAAQFNTVLQSCLLCLRMSARCDIVEFARQLLVTVQRSSLTLTDIARTILTKVEDQVVSTQPYSPCCCCC